MPLSLLPPLSLNLSSTREFVKFEVTCTDRPVPVRPVLPSSDSFSSSASSTDTSTSARKNRPSLSPEALLIHAFGPSALSRLTPPTSAGSATSECQATTHQTPSVSSVPSARSRASLNSSKRGHKEKHDIHPAPPPLGTFRSVAKSTRTSTPYGLKLPLTELMPFGAQRDVSQGEFNRHTASCECERNPEREFPISPELWREKVEERLQRRKLLRSKFRVEESVKIHLDVDCRPLESSIGLPPRSDVLVEESPGLKKRNHSFPAPLDLVNSVMKERKGELSVENEEEVQDGDDTLPRRKSMFEMRDIEKMIKQCDSMSI
ncbi:hypothetical protein ACEPAH_1663 [Sanghuangporus vaninii]